MDKGGDNDGGEIEREDLLFTGGVHRVQREGLPGLEIDERPSSRSPLTTRTHEVVGTRVRGNLKMHDSKRRRRPG